jgi:hypothetical protein
MSNGIAHHIFAVESGDFNCRLNAKHYYHEIASLGDFKGLHFVVYVASHLGRALCPERTESLTLQRPG